MSYTFVPYDHGRPGATEQGRPFFHTPQPGLPAERLSPAGHSGAAAASSPGDGPFSTHILPALQELGPEQTRLLALQLLAALCTQNGAASQTGSATQTRASQVTPEELAMLSAAQPPIAPQAAALPLPEDRALFPLEGAQELAGQALAGITQDHPLYAAAQPMQPGQTPAALLAAIPSQTVQSNVPPFRENMQWLTAPQPVGRGITDTPEAPPAPGTAAVEAVGQALPPAEPEVRTGMTPAQRPAEHVRSSEEAEAEEAAAAQAAIPEQSVAEDDAIVFPAEQPAGKGAEELGGKNAENDNAPPSSEAQLAELRAALDAAKVESERALAEKEQLLAEKERVIHDLLVRNAFSASPFLREKTVLPPEFAYAALSSNFTVEYQNGLPVVVARGADGNPLYSKADAKRYADPEEAIRQLIEQHPQRAALLRAAMPGGGSGATATARAGGGRLGPDEASRLSPGDYAKARRSGRL